jgi:hypothetical protein
MVLVLFLLEIGTIKMFEYLPEKAKLRDKNNIIEKHYQ